MDLITFNPWWKEKRVAEALIGRRRKIFDEVWGYLDLRQILVLSGLRRVGKTTLMFQLIDGLLNDKRVDSYHILYFSFDEAKSEIENILSEYQEEILKDSISKKTRVYLFFDEIQKLDNWPEKIKVVYDIYPNVKIFLSGSAAISVKKGTRESLAGRFFEFHIEPLDLDEYLEFKEVEIDKEREDVFEAEIKRHLEGFLRTGGFIEAMKFDEIQLDKYFKEGLLERVIYRDLPEAFPVGSPELLYKLIRLCAERPGMYLDYKNIANDLNYDQRTIASYFSYLEYALLISKLYNYSPNFLTSEKKMKRVYFSNTAFTMALSMGIDRSLLMEQFFVNLFRPKFFSRTPQKEEVDIVIVTEDKRVVPVEIKIKPDVKEREVRPLFKFLKRYGLNKGFVISDKTEKDFSKDDIVVKIVPYWKYWALRKEIGV